ncbi:hypothetical protein GCM10011374_38170 [Kocuria dechangensis]|uniref:STAS domain-containing protein n=1 Tax=Kocuria dechangensis TaxID=1176249 RepID=A0A917H752_9MICC|nr:hypothetical protein [Kocuria dechangensis]GGG70012.1 hypothetical protein GCM10011374_38170 [Kocuria dechangensis]
MNHKLSVLVQIDLHAQYVHLVITGCVTEANQHALHPVIARARTLIPPVTVTVDLTGAAHVEAAAVELLHAAIDQDHTFSGAGPVEVLVPAQLPGHRPVPHHGNALAGRTRARAALPGLRAA